MGNRIVHFEIPVTNAERMSKFYGDLFGWKFDKQSMPGMDYWMIETTGKGQTDLGGGMYVKQNDTEKPRFYVNVENIDEHTNKFKQIGGTVVVEKQEVPNMGYSILGTDPEGNLLGLWQPLTKNWQRNDAAGTSSSARKKAGGKAKKSKKSAKKGRR